MPDAPVERNAGYRYLSHASCLQEWRLMGKNTSSDLGPVVQSVVNLTMLLSRQLVK